jgi:hypothetical protein
LHDAFEQLHSPDLRRVVDAALSRRRPLLRRTLARFRRALSRVRSVLTGQEPLDLGSSLVDSLWTRPMKALSRLALHFAVAPSILDRVLLLNEIFFDHARKIVGLSLASSIFVEYVSMRNAQQFSL